MSAIDRSRPFGANTSMGFTPSEDLPMGTRSGDVDPAAVFFLMMHEECGRGVAEPTQWVAGDMRNLERHVHAARSLPRQGAARLAVETEISVPGARTRVCMIPTDKGPLIAREGAQCIPGDLK